MRKYIILNTVNIDGVGDFSHFEAIVKALKANSNFDDVEFLLLVLFLENEDRYPSCALYNDLLMRTHNLGCTYIFGTESEHRCRLGLNSYVSSQLIDASQVLIISYDKLFELYEPYFDKKAVIKFIPEHDASMSKQKTIQYPQSLVKYPRELLIRGLGLSSNCFGIKVKSEPNLTFTTAKETIQESDPSLFASMINCAGARDLEELLSDNKIIPAYFSYDWQFANFIAMISQNQTIHQEKNIIIYHSGTNFNNFNIDIRHQSFIEHILNDLAKCHIQVFSPDSNMPNLEFNNHGQSGISIKVFSGFNISYLSYQALYKLADIVGVSGDNTFELAVQSKVLPIYWSTNASFKEETFTGLQNILQNQDLGIESSVVESFLKFFELCKTGELDLKQIEKLNFVQLIQNWPVVAEHIKTKYNFYDKLESIVCEKLPHSALPIRLRSSSSIVYQAPVRLGFFGRMFSGNSREERCERELRKLPI